MGDMFTPDPTPNPADPNWATLDALLNQLGELGHVPTFQFIGDARAWLIEHLMEGARCPLCTRYSKVYRRNITSAMARFVIALRRKHEEEPEQWVHALTEIPYEERSGDYTKLVAWGLVAQRRGVNEAKDDTNPEVGYYKITNSGLDFVMDRIRVPKYKYFLMDEVIEIVEDGAPETISIRQALGTKFDYEGLMNG